MNVKKWLGICLALFYFNTFCLLADDIFTTNKTKTEFGRKLNTNFYEIIDYDALVPIQGLPKVITTKIYYEDSKEWDAEDSLLFDDKGRLVYLNNYPDEKSLIYDGDKIIYKSIKFSTEETYVYWFFYDAYDNPEIQIVAVKDNMTGKYTLHEVERHNTTYFKDSVIVNVKSSRKYLSNSNGITKVFDRNGNLKYKSYINTRGVSVSINYIYKKFNNKYVLQKEILEAAQGNIKSTATTDYTLANDGTVLKEELIQQDAFHLLFERYLVSTTFFNDSSKKVIHDSYNTSGIQKSQHYKYDKYGNNTFNAELDYKDKNSYYISLYDYEYDSNNNWIAKIEYMQETNKALEPLKEKMKLATYTRNIIYFTKDEKYTPEKAPDIPADLKKQITEQLEKLK